MLKRYTFGVDGQFSEQNSDISIPVLSFDKTSGESFFSELGLTPSLPCVLPFGDRLLNLQLVRILEDTTEDVESIVEGASAVVFLIKSLDNASLSLIKKTYGFLKSSTLVPITFAVLREPKEAQFKVSCTHCETTIWLRDRNAGQRGKCPQCGKMFLVPAQDRFLTSHLMLTDLVNLNVVTRNEDNYLSLLDLLANQTVGNQKPGTLAPKKAPRKSSLMKKLQTLWQ